MAAKQFLTLEDLAHRLNIDLSRPAGRMWLLKRTAPNTKLKPRIPKVENMGKLLRFDPDVIDRLFFTPPSDSKPDMPNANQVRSLTIERKKKSASRNRQKEVLW